MTRVPCEESFMLQTFFILNILPFSDNRGKNLRSSVKKSSKIGHDEKTLISAFASFLTTSTKVLFLERKLGTRLRLHQLLRFLQYILIS